MLVGETEKKDSDLLVMYCSAEKDTPPRYLFAVGISFEKISSFRPCLLPYCFAGVF